MKIENYKGVEVMHNAHKDEFYTNLVLVKGTNIRKDQVLSAPRLQQVRDKIDGFLNTSTKKPIIKKAWITEGYEGSAYELRDIVLFSHVGHSVLLKDKDGNTKDYRLNGNYGRQSIYISCKENDALIKALNEKTNQIIKLNKEKSCTGGKLIPLKEEHFN